MLGFCRMPRSGFSAAVLVLFIFFVAYHIIETDIGSAPHPIRRLVQKAGDEREKLLARQSRSLEEAVNEYRRKYKVAPPPNFDKWYEFARARDVVLIDEFDAIHEMLAPFWGLKPATIRKRAVEALGYENYLIGILIRNGTVAHQQGGRPWERKALPKMLGKFVKYLPDMDLAFNALDEPRVALQHDDLARLLAKAETAKLATSKGKQALSNGFTRAAELGNGNSIREVAVSRFFNLGKRSAWATARMSCSPDSPARSLEEEDDEMTDDTSRYCSEGPLCFVSDVTAFSDICSSPSFRKMHGFLDSPLSYVVTHDLVPIFSPSKLSTYSDIVFPAHWYWADRVPYNAEDDEPWESKTPERFVQKLNTLSDDVLTLSAPASDNSTTNTDPETPWTAEKSTIESHAHLLNVSFSQVGQCDPGDCSAQRAVFDLAPVAPQNNAWGFKYLLDLDGNAFSGRFQAFLRSNSLVLKFALFREWTGGSGGWLAAWRDYIPLSLHGDEWIETVRYLAEEEEGKRVAEEMASNSSEWARKVLRKEDMEVWFFRLLLEYGRVVDDNRESIGFTI
ncbi:unnamed protein product [Parascedosporium putredinis]|uniref:Glycosyl transferase CAP10 domain-containing protein n=1 Tax=Parascedosporium putredinis TaxID=1442378 RepID=A0A9P1H9R0_9PEZI|nr:unnamed protein product [Parascedosporium putredinis]CAI8000684.1 unnamed protein product [Parascedosporium putredinis]